MLEVTFGKDDRNRPSSVFSSGHVEIAATSSDRYSLVCSAVSSILQAARLGLEAHVRLPLEVTQRSGELFMRWPSEFRDDQRVIAIVETARLSVVQIARQYPKHVRVREQQEA